MTVGQWRYESLILLQAAILSTADMLTPLLQDGPPASSSTAQPNGGKMVAVDRLLACSSSLRAVCSRLVLMTELWDELDGLQDVRPKTVC
jgi:hypothetical protein